MRHVKFTIHEDADYGIVGAIPNIFRGWSNYLPAIDLAHDLLEHGTKETGAFDEEMAALGGFLFVRNFGNSRPHIFSVAQNLAGSSGTSYQESTIEGVRPAPRAYGLSRKEISRLEYFSIEFRDESIENWNDEILSGYEANDESAPDCPFEDDETWARILGWIKYGYARAKRRFHNDMDSAWATFEAVEKACKIIPDLSNYEGTGVEITMAIDYRNGWAEIRIPEYL